MWRTQVHMGHVRKLRAQHGAECTREARKGNKSWDTETRGWDGTTAPSQQLEFGYLKLNLEPEEKSFSAAPEGNLPRREP